MNKTLIVFILCIASVCSLFASDTIIVNEMLASEPELRFTFIDKPLKVKKSDGIVVEDYGKNGCDVFLIDGGMDTGYTLSYLENLRSGILESAGLEDKIPDENYKLRLTLLVTHFHSDHVDELFNRVLISPLFTVEALYASSPTLMTQDNTFDNKGNSDINERAEVYKVLKENHPSARIVELPFSSVYDIPIENGMIRLYAPIADWGVGDEIRYIIDKYYPQSSEQKIWKDVPLAVINSDCMWIRFSYMGLSALFPGDVMKKNYDPDEPFDRMIDFYGSDELRSDLVKYPHHGISRNNAARRLAKNLIKDSGSYAVIGANGAAKESGAILKRLGISFADYSMNKVTFIFDKEGMHLL